MLCSVGTARCTVAKLASNVIITIPPKIPHSTFYVPFVGLIRVFIVPCVDKGTATELLYHTPNSVGIIPILLRRSLNYTRHDFGFRKRFFDEMSSWDLAPPSTPATIKI